MCGIAGFVDFSKRSSVDDANRMADRLHHRGPDGHGAFFRENAFASIGLGHQRLSVIDLSEKAAQPMIDADSGFVLVYNGEIYNYRSVRNQLIAAGYRFNSSSDTEVILQSMAHWGIEGVNRLFGMFALALYDRQNEQLILVRDRIGVKPLYWYFHNGLFLFGSELKSFHVHPRFEKKISDSGLTSFFRNGYIPAPLSIFQNTWKLKPGHYAVLSFRNQTVTEHAYWQLRPDPANKVDCTYDEAKAETENRLSEAFNLRLESDVPVGVFLSGGYDSACVAAMLQKKSAQQITTFTIGFEEEAYDESRFARAVAGHLQTLHHEELCTIQSSLDLVEFLPEFYDEPFGDSSAIPTLLVSRIARKHVKVILSADGGDELFGGYKRYLRFQRYMKLFSRVNPSGAAMLSRLLSRVNSSEKVTWNKTNLSVVKTALKITDALEMYNILMEKFSENECKYLLINNAGLSSSAQYHTCENLFYETNLKGAMCIDFHNYLPGDILCKVDRATMAFGLEGREPFLDHRLAEWTFNLPQHYLFDKKTGKRILKDIVHQYIPKSLLNRPKKGFSVPVASWFKNELKELYNQVLSEDELKKNPYLDNTAVKEIKQLFTSGQLKSFEKLWLVFVFQQWYKRWMS